MTKRLAQVAVVLAALCSASAYATPVLTLTPSGNTGGPPGTIVGWGYSLMNDTSFVLLVDNSFFCQPGQNPQFVTCTQTQGTYTDYIATNGTLVSPNSTAIQPFSQGNPGMGVGQYAISPGAKPPSMDSGSVFISFQECAQDFSTCSGDMFISASASVTVTPEPAPFALFGAGLAALGLLRFRRRAR